MIIVGRQITAISPETLLPLALLLTILALFLPPNTTLCAKIDRWSGKLQIPDSDQEEYKRLSKPVMCFWPLIAVLSWRSLPRVLIFHPFHPLQLLLMELFLACRDGTISACRPCAPVICRLNTGCIENTDLDTFMHERTHTERMLDLRPSSY